jgi:hypothetical protein
LVCPIADRREGRKVVRDATAAKDYMEDQMTIEDSVAFARPWKVTLTFRRMKRVDKLVPTDCSENDRNPIVNGKFKIAPRKP